MRREPMSFEGIIGRHRPNAAWCAAVLWLALSTGTASAAELSVGSTRIRPSATRSVIVAGAVDGEETYGVTIMVELVPRPGNIGSVAFTTVADAKSIPGSAALRRGSVSVHSRVGEPDEVRITRARPADVDVVQLGDPWPDRGNFSSFDTDLSGSPTLNGAVDDNGTFLNAPVSFSGALASFPIAASPDARGVWDVLLATSKGESGWENVATTLVAGTVTVSPRDCTADRECVDANSCTLDRCRSGACEHVLLDNAACVDAHPGKKRKAANNPRRAGSRSD